MTKPLKHCGKCQTVKPTNQFNNDKSRHDGLAPHCKQCRSNYKKALVERHELHRKRPVAFTQICKTCDRELNGSAFHLNRNRKSGIDHRCKECEKSRSFHSHKHSTRNLSDGYVRKRLTADGGISASNVPKQLIEIKRLQMQILREIKDVTNEKR